MFTAEQQLDDLLRHLTRVRDNGRLLGQRLMEQGRKDFGWQVIHRCHIHDASKFYGIEREFLHKGENVDVVMLHMAIDQHTSTNSHHPEFHGGIRNMPELDIAEMVCDCAARAQESGTDIRKWFTDVALKKYKIDTLSHQWIWVQNFLDILLKTSFKKDADR